VKTGGYQKHGDWEGGTLDVVGVPMYLKKVNVGTMWRFTDRRC
jgi:hypothetical protein